MQRAVALNKELCVIGVILFTFYIYGTVNVTSLHCILALSFYLLSIWHDKFFNRYGVYGICVRFHAYVTLKSKVFVWQERNKTNHADMYFSTILFACVRFLSHFQRILYKISIGFHFSKYSIFMWFLSVSSSFFLSIVQLNCIVRDFVCGFIKIGGWKGIDIGHWWFNQNKSTISTRREPDERKRYDDVERKYGIQFWLPNRTHKAHTVKIGCVCLNVDTIIVYTPR